VTDDTVKAIAQREAVPIAARKEELLSKALRIASSAADCIEDELAFSRSFSTVWRFFAAKLRNSAQGVANQIC
jgi:hypothetical protein